MTSVKSILLLIVSLLIVPATLLAQEEQEEDLNTPSIGTLPSIGTSGLEQYGNTVMRDIAEKARSRISEMEAEIKPNILQAQVDYLASQGKDEQETAENFIRNAKRWQNWQGAEQSVVSEANAEHSTSAITAFQDCQEPYNHSFLGMLIPSSDDPTNIFDEVLIELYEAMDCAVSHKGYLGSFSLDRNWLTGDSIGFAIRCDYNPAYPYGPLCFCQSGNVVEYFAPVQKMNISSQKFQTSVFTKHEVQTDLKQIEAIDDLLPGSMSDTIAIAQRKGKVNAHIAGHRGSLETKLPLGYNVKAELQDVYDTKLKAIREKYPDFKHMARSQSEHYSRMITEGINLVNLMLKEQPHHIIHVNFGTDFRSGYPFAKLFHFSASWQKQYKAFLQDGGEFSCLRNNIANSRGRTPVLPLANGRSLQAVDYFFRGQTDNNDLCLDNIGEKYHMLASQRRQADSDMVWAGVAKGMAVLDRAVSFIAAFANLSGAGALLRGKYDYYPDLDKWFVASKGDLQTETPQCDILDNLTRPPVGYDKTNMLRIGTGSEDTIESFPRFKGVRGYPGKDPVFFLSGTCPIPSLIIPYGESAYAPDEFRLGTKGLKEIARDNT